MKAASQHYYSIKTQSSKPTSHTKLDAELETHISTKYEAQALPQRLNARPEARVSTIEEPCVPVIIALITGSITAHEIRELTPLRSIFRGQFYP